MDNTEPIIKLTRISKKFRLYARPFDRLKEALHPFGKQLHAEHWALQDISLAVGQGETLGIMGRNGAGKSTLLQIITSVLEPTSGELSVAGRISALLELGAGFNPELTGRENVFAQAPLMRIGKAEMLKLMPEIEDFADIGEYMDQPVKTYSSGMFVRLAFSLSMTVNPDILIIDEALAVGDANFQDKCFKKLKEFKDKGKTFLLVSHSASLISMLCDRVVVIEDGRISFSGPPREGLVHYGKLLFGNKSPSAQDARDFVAEEEQPLGQIAPDSHINSADLNDFTDTTLISQRCGYNKYEIRSGSSDVACIFDFIISSGNNYDTNIIPTNSHVKFFVKIKAFEKVESPRISISIHTPSGLLVFGTNTKLLKRTIGSIEGDDCKLYCFELKNNLNAGDYLISIGLVDDGIFETRKLDVRESIATIKIEGIEKYNGLCNLSANISEIR